MLWEWPSKVMWATSSSATAKPARRNNQGTDAGESIGAAQRANDQISKVGRAYRADSDQTAARRWWEFTAAPHLPRGSGLVECPPGSGALLSTTPRSGRSACRDVLRHRLARDATGTCSFPACRPAPLPPFVASESSTTREEVST